MLSRLKALVRRLLAGRPPAASPAPVDQNASRVVQVRRLDPAMLADEPSVTAFQALDGAWTAQMKDAEVLVAGGAFCVMTPGGAALMDGLEREPARVFGTGEAVAIDLTGRPAPWRVLEPTVLIGGDADEARWRDALAKIGVWRRSGLGTELIVRFLVHADITSDQVDGLHALGIAPDRIVRADPLSIRRFDKLLVPSVDRPDSAAAFLLALPAVTPAAAVDLEPTVATLGRFPSLAGQF